MKFLKAVMMVAATAILPGVALAETHTLQPYACVQAHGTNRVDTGYCAKPLSRYFVDYQLVNVSTPAQGIFGDTKPTTIKCAFYAPNNAADTITWYYRKSSPPTNYTIAGIRDTKRRVMTAIHPTTTSGTATVSATLLSPLMCRKLLRNSSICFDFPRTTIVSRHSLCVRCACCEQTIDSPKSCCA